VLLDANNNIYLAGRTDSTDFPVTPGAYVIKNPGASQVYVARLTSDCAKLDWASEVEQFQPNPGSLGQFFDLGAIGFAVDPSSGDLFVASDTADQHLATTADAAQKSFGGGTYDGFLMELDSSAANVLYATYFGGTGDDGINALALDTQGNVFMTGADLVHRFSADLQRVPDRIRRNYRPACRQSRRLLRRARHRYDWFGLSYFGRQRGLGDADDHGQQPANRRDRHAGQGRATDCCGTC
jgi:hypothetical protein